VSDQAVQSKYDKKEQSKTGEHVPDKVQQPKTSEGILHTALVHRTKDFFSQHVFGDLKEARMVFYGGSLPLLINSAVNTSPDALRQAGIYLGVSIGLGLIEVARAKSGVKPALKPSMAQNLK